MGWLIARPGDTWRHLLPVETNRTGFGLEAGKLLGF
jgi:hypothetical protein